MGGSGHPKSDSNHYETDLKAESCPADSPRMVDSVVPICKAHRYFRHPQASEIPQDSSRYPLIGTRLMSVVTSSPATPLGSTRTPKTSCFPRAIHPALIITPALIISGDDIISSQNVPPPSIISSEKNTSYLKLQMSI